MCRCGHFITCGCGCFLNGRFKHMRMRTFSVWQISTMKMRRFSVLQIQAHANTGLCRISSFLPSWWCGREEDQSETRSTHLHAAQTHSLGVCSQQYVFNFFVFFLPLQVFHPLSPSLSLSLSLSLSFWVGGWGGGGSSSSQNAKEILLFLFLNETKQNVVSFLSC